MRLQKQTGLFSSSSVLYLVSVQELFMVHQQSMQGNLLFPLHPSSTFAAVFAGPLQQQNQVWDLLCQGHTRTRTHSLWRGSLEAHSRRNFSTHCSDWCHISKKI